MSSVKIAGRDVPIGEILEVYVDGIKWKAVVWGESAVEIDPFIADEIISLVPNIVAPEIIQIREGAKRFSKAMKDWQV